MGFIHFGMAIAIVVLSDPDRGLVPITTSFLSFNPNTQALETVTKQLMEVNIAWFVAIFFIICSVAHFFVATVYRKGYEENLDKGINKVRWFEYSLSASTMMVAISLLSGIYDLSTLIAVFTLVAVMNLCGLAMEVYNSGKEKPNWIAFNIGTIAGIIPWVIFAVYVYGARQYGTGDIPTFVYWIYVSIFIMFNSFAINMLLQYKKVGPWKDYLYGEKVYILLSLTAKTLLAWQIFAGTLRP
jgi:hypothetical protein